MILIERGLKSNASQLRAWGAKWHSDREGSEKAMLRSSRLEVKTSILIEGC
jgi:hypothetical protein